MKNKIKKNYSTIRKFILAFAITLVVLFGYNFALEYKESKNAYKINKDDKLLLIKYTLVDKEKMGDDSTIDQLWFNGHFDALYNIVLDEVKLQKENDYYVADLSYLNSAVTKEITDVTFAMNNDFGEVINDCKFDKENLKIYIPTSYYDNEQEPVQTQILSKIENDSVAINYKKGNKKKKIVADVYDNVLKIPVANSEKKGHSLSKNDITVLVNGKKYYLDDSNSNYYKNGSLDIDFNGALVNNIEVKIDKKNVFRKIAEKIFTATIVKANSLSNYDFSTYKSIGIVPRSEASQVAEDTVYYWLKSSNTHKVSATVSSTSGMARFTTRCAYSYNSDLYNCLMYPFDYYNGNTTNHTAADNALSTGNTSAYCSSVFSDGNFQGWCNDWFNFVKSYKASYPELTYDQCKGMAYFLFNNGKDESLHLFNSFINSHDKLIFKRDNETITPCQSGGDSHSEYSDSACYVEELFRYIYYNDNSSPEPYSIGTSVIGRDDVTRVFQFIHFPNAGHTDWFGGWIGEQEHPYSESWSSYALGQTFPLNLKDAVYDTHGETDGYALAYCGHVSQSVAQNHAQIIDIRDDYSKDKTLGIKVVKVTNDYLIVAAASFPTGYSDAEQSAYGIYKFDIGNKKKGKITLTKTYNLSDDESLKSSAVFDIYEGTQSGSTYTCSGNKIASTTYSGGTFTVDNLEVDKAYCIYERGSHNDFDVSYKIGTTDVTKTATFTSDGKQYKVGFVTINSSSITPTTSGDTDTYTLSMSANNRRKKYCYGIKKQDVETNSSLYSSGTDLNQKFTFIYGNNEQVKETTTNSNLVVFGPFNKGTYTIKEKDKDNENKALIVTAVQTSDNKNYTYWTDAGNISVNMDNAVEASYDSNSNSYSCDNASTTTLLNKAAIKNNPKVYYCTRIKKIDSSNNNTPLAGAKFTSKYAGYNSAGTQDGLTLNDGLYYFFTGNDKTDLTVTETVVPDGYFAPDLTKVVTPIAMSSDVRSNTSIANLITACNNAYGDNAEIVNNYRYLINWYKVEENNLPINGAKFIVKDSDGKYLKLSAVAEQSDKDGNKKKCYGLTGTTTSEREATVVESQNVGINTDMNGEVCISGLNPGNYTVIETDSAENHTLGSVNEKTLESFENYQSKTNTNTFVNYPTRVEFYKESTDGDTSSITKEELAKIGFSIFEQDENGNPTGNAIVVKQTGIGTYDYITEGTETTVLHVSPEDSKFVIEHLPKDKYVIEEIKGTTCDDSGNPDDCIGYYMPSGTANTHRFEVTKCSSDNASSCGIDEYGKIIITVMNTPTEINFDELDYYRHYDMEDIAIEGNTVTGETSTGMERSDFDRMVFTLYDKNDVPVTLQYVGNHGDCTSDGDYSEYRYVVGATTGSTELHTCGGHIKITHLCRGGKYTIKQESVASNSVFVHEDTPSTPMAKDYQVACDPTDPDEPRTETNIIENKPTRVTFEKRDGKYNYIITDETTTFEVYRCPDNQECHPANYTSVEAREAAGMERVVFRPRDYISTVVDGVVRTDEEDPGVQVYRMVSFSDKKTMSKCENGNRNNCYETEVHPYNGKLVFRYLASGYNYVLLETVAPKNYLLPDGIKAETQFPVINTTVDVEEVNVPNQPTGLLIRKYDDHGNLLGGAKFRVYKVTEYNPNVKASKQSKQLLKFKTIKQGVYEDRPVQDTSEVMTCEGSECNNTDSFTYLDYQRRLNFDDILTSSGETIKNVLKEGTALIQYLEYDNYYVIEEVEAPKGHSLPEGDAKYTLVHIGRNTTVIEDTEQAFINYPTKFTFYKFDEYNNPLDGAKFKLQKLNDNKSYVTMKVRREESAESLYKVDETSENEIIETTGGKATVYYLEEGQYRIVEVEAAPGKELPKKRINVVTFYVDKNGKIIGENNNIITNKAPTEKKIVPPEAKANLIINIQTGQSVVKYGLLIAVLIAAITGLMIFIKKRK